MPPKLIVDLAGIDLSETQFDIEKVRKLNQQRYEMEQLSGIIKFAPEDDYVVGYKDVSDDEFWVRGHVPGRPLMPGVIMCEAAAQLCSFYYMMTLADGERDRFLGFGGMKDVKFRGTVVPGDRLIILARKIEIKPRRAIFNTQGVLDGKMVFEAGIIGMPV